MDGWKCAGDVLWGAVVRSVGGGCVEIGLNTWDIWSGSTGKYLGREDEEVHTSYFVCTGSDAGISNSTGRLPDGPPTNRETLTCRKVDDQAKQARKDLPSRVTYENGIRNF